jgi:hypothetical protein
MYGIVTQIPYFHFSRQNNPEFFEIWTDLLQESRAGTAARLLRKILPNNLRNSGPYDISSSGATDVLETLLKYLNNLNGHLYLGDAETQLQGLVEERQNIQVQLASEQKKQPGSTRCLFTATSRLHHGPGLPLMEEARGPYVNMTTLVY